MEPLNLPPYTFSFREQSGTRFVLDPVRKKWVVLTPEEWVRINFVQYLLRECRVPVGLLALEQTLRLNTLQRRADIIVYDRTGAPLLLVECKRPSYKLREEVFEQAARYNRVLKAPFLLVTNGLVHAACRISFVDETITYLREIPDYEGMLAERDGKSASAT